MKKGVESLLLLVAFASNFFKQLADALSGKKKLGKLKVFGFLLQVPGLIERMPEVKEELRDLDEEETEALLAAIALRFQVSAEKAKQLAEVLANWLHQTFDAYQSVMAILSNPKSEA